MIGRSTPLLIFCSTSGGAGSDALMPLKLRPTGLGAGIDKDCPDYTVFGSEWRSGASTIPRRSRTRSDRVATLEEAKAHLRKSWDAWKAWAQGFSPTERLALSQGVLCSRR